MQILSDIQFQYTFNYNQYDTLYCRMLILLQEF